MAMGEREEDRQQAVFVSTSELRSAGHPFYRAVNGILRDAEFDRFAEQQCRKFYAEKGQPSIAPGVYFRMLMVWVLRRDRGPPPFVSNVASAWRLCRSSRCALLPG